MRVIIVYIVPEVIGVQWHFVTFSILFILRFGPAYVPSRGRDKGWRNPSATKLKTPSLTHILWPDWAHPSSTSQDEAINTVLHRRRVTAVTRLRWCAVINIKIKSSVPTRFNVCRPTSLQVEKMKGWFCEEIVYKYICVVAQLYFKTNKRVIWNWIEFESINHRSVIDIGFLWWVWNGLQWML